MTAQGYGRIATKYHKTLETLLTPHRGEVITPAHLRSYLRRNSRLSPEQVAWVLPSDHCVNHTNKGACECACTPGALFERVEHGRYRVL